MSLRFTLRNTTSDRHVTICSNIQLGNFELIGSDGLRGGKTLMQFTIEMDGSDFCLIFLLLLRNLCSIWRYLLLPNIENFEWLAMSIHFSSRDLLSSLVQKAYYMIGGADFFKRFLMTSSVSAPSLAE